MCALYYYSCSFTTTPFCRPSSSRRTRRSSSQLSLVVTACGGGVDTLTRPSLGSGVSRFNRRLSRVIRRTSLVSPTNIILYIKIYKGFPWIYIISCISKEIPLNIICSLRVFHISSWRGGASGSDAAPDASSVMISLCYGVLHTAGGEHSLGITP